MREPCDETPIDFDVVCSHPWHCSFLSVLVESTPTDHSKARDDDAVDDLSLSSLRPECSVEDDCTTDPKFSIVADNRRCTKDPLGDYAKDSTTLGKERGNRASVEGFQNDYARD